MKILVTPYVVHHDSMIVTDNAITNERPNTLLIIDENFKTTSTDRSTYV